MSRFDRAFAFAQDFNRGAQGLEVKRDTWRLSFRMKSDGDIQRDVEQELQWDPQVGGADIAVAVKNGVVTLTGFVQTYGQKMQAEAAAKRVGGVLALANDIEVRLSIADGRPDPEIARDAAAALRSQLPLFERIKPVVESGWVTLDGEVQWNDGHEVARRLRDLPATRLALLIALSGYGQPDDRQRSLDAGFDHHLVKPATPERVRQ